MLMRQFMGIDLGTSAVKCLVADESGMILTKARRSYSHISTKPGHLEQNPQDWWTATKEAILECVSKLPSNEITAISVSGHMSAPVLIDQARNVIGNAILIADTRSAKESTLLREQYADEFLHATGNIPIDAFTVSKLLWLQENRQDLCEKIDQVIFPKDYIRLMLTGEVATDHTDAGNTLLYDFKQKVWNRDLIQKVGIPIEWFPRLEESTAICGTITKAASEETGLRERAPVICGAADMACSQIGVGGFFEEVIALTLSTSIQVVLAVPQILTSLTRKLTYHPSAVEGKLYAMASIFSGGMSVDWLYKLLNDTTSISGEDYIKFNQAIQKRYLEHPLNDMIFLPFLTGSGSPWFDAKDRGGFFGMTPDLKREDLTLAVFEGIAYNIKDNIDLIESGMPRDFQIHLAGGGSMFSSWTEILANILERPINVLEQKDVSSLGTVILAGVGVGAFRNFKDCFNVFNKVECTVEPNPEHTAHYQSKYPKYQKLHHAIRESL